MSYTRIDDGILTHPKMADAEEACPVFAWVLWTKALVYVNQHKLDGRVTKKIAARLVGAANVDAAVAALVSTGLWDEDEDGYRFHDFTEHNATKDQRAEKARKNAEAQEAHRKKVREEKAAARLAAVSADASTSKQDSKQTVSAYEKESKAPPLHSSPLLSTPLPLPSEAERDPEDPSEDDLFKTYTVAANAASALAMKYVRDDRNAQALSTVWGTYGYAAKQTPAEFLESLAGRVGEYVADCMARKQPAQFEGQYAPYRFLAWLTATKAGVDPFPRAPVAIDGTTRGGSQGSRPQGPSSPYSDPTPEDIARMTGRAS